MSGLAASLMFTPYRATKRRMAAVVSEPALADANLPASAVSACLGYRYCGRTARRADTLGSTRKGGEVYRRWRNGQRTSHRRRVGKAKRARGFEGRRVG